METIAGLLEQHKVETLIILGDLTEQKDHHGAGHVNDVVELLYCLTQFCPVIVLRGNHDYVDADAPFFMFTRRLERLTWVNKPQLINVQGLRAWFLPHTMNYVRDWANLDWDLSHLIFAHQTFQGASIGRDLRLEGIPMKVIPSGRLVISGDIHVPQYLSPVLYTGSPFTVDFGDDFEPRVILLKSEREWQSIPVPGAQKRLLVLGSDGVGVQGFANPGDIVKIRCRLEPADQEHWPEIKSQIRQAFAHCQIYAIQPEYDSKPSIAPVTPGLVKTDQQVVRDFAKQVKWSQSVLETGLDLCGAA